MNITFNFQSSVQNILKRCSFIMQFTLIMAALFTSMANAQTGAVAADSENKFLLVQQAFPFLLPLRSANTRRPTMNTQINLKLNRRLAAPLAVLISSSFLLTSKLICSLSFSSNSSRL